MKMMYETFSAASILKDHLKIEALNQNPSPNLKAFWPIVISIEMKGITKCKLTIISESAIRKKFLGQSISYLASLWISKSFIRMLCCYLNVFVYINECIDVNTALKNSLKSISC
jgi:hypothetical protein